MRPLVIKTAVLPESPAGAHQQQQQRQVEPPSPIHQQPMFKQQQQQQQPVSVAKTDSPSALAAQALPKAEALVVALRTLALGGSADAVALSQAQQLPALIDRILSAPREVSAPVRQEYNPPAQQSYSSAAVASAPSTAASTNGDWRSQPDDWVLTRKRSKTFGSLPDPEIRPPETPAVSVAPVQPATTDWMPRRNSQELVRSKSVSSSRLSTTPTSVAPPVVASTNPNDHPDLSEQGMDWKQAIKTKQQRMTIAQERAEQARQAEEEAKWSGVPEWKRSLLSEKERKRQEAEAPLREAERLKREAQERFNSLPAWKQKLLIEKGLQA